MLLTLKVAYAVPVNTLSPDCFLGIIFLLKLLSLFLIMEIMAIIEKIIIFMNYDSMKDI